MTSPAEVLQIIDEQKTFNEHTAAYLARVAKPEVGLGYHLVSVFGSQSTGKSTLLNALFGTSFGVMADAQRGQTTHGIWLGHADLPLPDAGASNPQTLSTAAGSNPLFVLDVEGTDGRERGEDQDFERKAALFALASSEVLIVNMWEHQVGLYQGANMGLLRTVFEVNLSLFQVSGKAPRSRVLFVIRDHIGTTPLDNLAATLLADLEKHWATIAKPTKELESSRIQDFFDIAFTTLPHKVLMPEKFVEGVSLLRRRFVDKDDKDYVFDPSYHRRVPLDGWPLYADQIWQQIELNKDLDLPTQQILVARFRTQEISDAAWEHFSDAVTALNLPLGTDNIINGFGVALRPLRSKVIDEYDSQASKYDQKVYAAQRLELLGKVDALLSSHFRSHLGALHYGTLKKFRAAVKENTASGATFPVAISAARTAALAVFTQEATEATLDPSSYSFHPQLDTFTEALDAEAASLRTAELNRLAGSLSKKVARLLDDELPHVFRQPTTLTWQQAHDTLTDAIKVALRPYQDGADFGLGATREENEIAKDKVVLAAWKEFDKRVAELVRREVVVQKLRDSFEERFQYDDKGLPILWRQGDDIEGSFVTAKESALKVLPIYAQARLPDDTFLTRPEFPDLDPEEVELLIQYDRLISNADQDDITSRFKRDAENAFLSAKRSVAQTAVHIPYYIYIALILLGWNEFMAILRNPLLVALSLILGAGAYVLYSLNLVQPALAVAQTTLDKTREVAKEKLRDYLADGRPQTQPRSSAFGEEIELQELNSGRDTAVGTQGSRFSVEKEPTAVKASDERLHGLVSTEASDSAASHSFDSSSAVTDSAHASPRQATTPARRPSSETRLRKPSNDLLTEQPKLGAVPRKSGVAATPLPSQEVVSETLIDYKLAATQRHVGQ